MATPKILDKILLRKRQEVIERRARIPEAELVAKLEGMQSTRGFTEALRQKVSSGQPAVIAELKKASPSKGIIREDFSPATIARSYEAGGAACLSVLTDMDFFQGSDHYLIEAVQASSLPVLRKDFTIDSYQIYEARYLGADCILLIVSALDGRSLGEFYSLARDIGLDVLIEVHDREELELAMALNPSVIGINNRNLDTFETDLNTTLSLLPYIPGRTLVVTESGIHTREDVEKMTSRGVLSFLVGETLMRARIPGDKLKQLFFNAD
jgi:indole-3-glycerol phosphate synthase